MPATRKTRYVVPNGTFTLLDVQTHKDIQGRSHLGLMTGAISRPSGTIEVLDVDFTTGKTVLYLGDYELQEAIQYTCDPLSLDNTATALAAAIANLPGYTAAAIAAVVSFSGPTNYDNKHIPFTVKYYGTVVNFALSPTTGVLSTGGPVFGAPGIT